MGDKTSIEWTSATWNPIRGCSRITAGCGGPNHQGGCYAEKIAARFSGPGQPFEGFAERTKYGGRWTGKMALVDSMLDQPLRWRKPRLIFVNSMSDLFHENLPDEAIDKVFAVMALAPHHRFQVLTKRSGRMREYLNAPGRQAAIVDALIDLAPIGRILKNRPILGGPTVEIEHWPLPNVWLGVSVEDQQRADGRIPDLLATPAAIRWISAEPLLGPLVMDGRNMVGDETYWDWLKGERGAGVQYVAVKPERTAKLDWIVAGGESGPNARPAHPDWFRSLRDQCEAAGVPFFFKQWGEWGLGAIGATRDWRPEFDDKLGQLVPSHTVFGDPAFLAISGRKTERINLVERFGKKQGATLDGREHRDMPA